MGVFSGGAQDFGGSAPISGAAAAGPASVKSPAFDRQLMKRFELERLRFLELLTDSYA
jgi:hypothetical protein